MLLIRNIGDGKANLTPGEHQKFLAGCETYIEELKKKGQLKSAQPLVREGKMISMENGSFIESAFNESNEVQVGYYHILANDLDEAVAIAKRNPEFAFVKGAKIEVRPIKMKEQSTNYTYPTK